MNGMEVYPEIMGAMTWKGEVMKYMQKRLKPFPVMYKQSKNRRMIDNLHREYMALIASGYKKADILTGSGDLLKWNRQTYEMARKITDRLNVNNLLTLNFFIAMYNLARQGKIPFEKWDPKGYEKSEKQKKTFKTEKTIFEKTAEKAGNITKLLMPLSIGAGIITALLMWGRTQQRR